MRCNPDHLRLQISVGPIPTIQQKFVCPLISMTKVCNYFVCFSFCYGILMYHANCQSLVYISEIRITFIAFTKCESQILVMLRNLKSFDYTYFTPLSMVQKLPQKMSKISSNPLFSLLREKAWSFGYLPKLQ